MTILWIVGGLMLISAVVTVFGRRSIKRTNDYLNDCIERGEV